MQTNCTFIPSNFVIHPPILIFSVRVFPRTECKWNFSCRCSFTCLLLRSFVASEIRHSRRHCSVCQQSTWYSATRTRRWQDFDKNT